MGLFQKKSVEVVGKTLTVKLFDRNSPSYKFDGEWTGRDIMVIGRTIARAYRTEQRAKRRDAAPVSVVSEQLETPTMREEVV